MKKNLKNNINSFESFFSSEPDYEEKGWKLLHDFYNLLLTFKEQQNLKQVDIANKLGVTPAAVSQWLNKNPNISIMQMAKLADAFGMSIGLFSKDVNASIPRYEHVIDSIPITYMVQEDFSEVVNKPSMRINDKVILKSDMVEYSSWDVK